MHTDELLGRRKRRQLEEVVIVAILDAATRGRCRRSKVAAHEGEGSQRTKAEEGTSRRQRWFNALE